MCINMTIISFKALFKNKKGVLSMNSLSICKQLLLIQQDLHILIGGGDSCYAEFVNKDVDNVW